MDWTKIVVAVISALVVGLQGTNIVQGVAIQSTEARIERVEDDLAKANLELNRLIVANQEEFKKKTIQFDQTLLANQNEFRKNVGEFEQHFQNIENWQKAHP